MTTNVPMSEMPGWMLALLAVLVVVQLSIEIYALVRLFKTPNDRLVLGKKWPWIIIILFVNLVGAIIFLVAGRTPAPATDPLDEGATPAGDRAARAADVLYGEQGGEL